MQKIGAVTITGEIDFATVNGGHSVVGRGKDVREAAHRAKADKRARSKLAMMCGIEGSSFLFDSEGGGRPSSSALYRTQYLVKLGLYR
jgi:hypothetical protein